MSNRVALVTGASRGIGRACSIALAQEGATIAVAYHSDADAAKETLVAVESVGSEGICVSVDVADSRSVDRLFSQVEEALGPVSILVNNAGVRKDGLALRLTDEAWSEVLATNLNGPFYCSRRALPNMVRSRWGRIVNISSVAGLRGSPGQANYSAAKAGLIGLTRSLAREVASRKITVNAIAPGLVATDLTSDLNDEQRNRLLADIPAGIEGSSEQVAELVRYVSSDAASYVTGTVLTMDGGMSC